MKIYRRKDFLELPEGTIYAKGKPWFFSYLSVKGKTLSNDWSQLSPMWIEAYDDGEQWRRLDDMLENGASYPMQTSYGRDGCFDDDDLFLVPERDDLEKLRAMIDDAISVQSQHAAPASSERSSAKSPPEHPPTQRE